MSGKKQKDPLSFWAVVFCLNLLYQILYVFNFY